jgi:hypothetical protein
MKALIISLALLLAVGCETVPMSSGGGDGDNVRYECYTYDYPAQHVLTLPVAPLNSEVGMVDVTFHGDQLDATYVRSGLSQTWFFEDRLYVKVDPDLDAQYWDFRGADEGEERKPESIFECKKRR